jgi:hypothetical protein
MRSLLVNNCSNKGSFQGLGMFERDIVVVEALQIVGGVLTGEPFQFNFKISCLIIITRYYL